MSVNLPDSTISAIEAEVDSQARALPRVDIMRESIPKSIIVKTTSLEQAIGFSNDYAPEHLILHLRDAPSVVAQVENAGSVFVGPYSPERYAVPHEVRIEHTTDGLTFLEQLRRLRIRYESYTTYERLREAVQRCQHPIVPKAHHLTRSNR